MRAPPCTHRQHARPARFSTRLRRVRSQWHPCYSREMTNNETLHWSRGLSQLAAYLTGVQPEGDGWIKLNTNENPYGPSPLALDAARGAIADGLRLYPDPSARVLREAVASVHGVDPECVFCGNGSDEILAFAFRAFMDHGEEILFPDVTYSFYPIWARNFGIPFRTVPLRDDFSIAPDDFAGDCGGIVLPNPNAPTGRALSLPEMERLVQAHPKRLVLVDEAYIDFSGGSAIPLTLQHPNVLVVQTLSKSRSLAGLRAAFAVGSRGLVKALELVRDGYNSYTLEQGRAGSCGGGRPGYSVDGRALRAHPCDPRPIRYGPQRAGLVGGAVPGELCPCRPSAARGPGGAGSASRPADTRAGLPRATPTTSRPGHHWNGCRDGCPGGGAEDHLTVVNNATPKPTMETIVKKRGVSITVALLGRECGAARGGWRESTHGCAHRYPLDGDRKGATLEERKQALGVRQPNGVAQVR